MGPINKTMDRGDLDLPRAWAVVGELDDLVRELRDRDLRISLGTGRSRCPSIPRACNI
jgi:hypothetical protein